MGQGSVGQLCWVLCSGLHEFAMKVSVKLLSHSEIRVFFEAPLIAGRIRFLVLHD